MSHTVLLLLPLLLAGAAAGILAGLLGVGGGIVIVPLLYHSYSAQGVPEAIVMQLAVGTSLATIVCTALVSARSHQRRKTIDWVLLRRWLPYILAGVVLGVAMVGAMTGTWLKTWFGGVLMLVALHMLLTAGRGLVLREGLPGKGVQSLLAATVGTLSSMLGIGGGTLVVPLLGLYAYPIHNAVATASVLGFAISVPATLGYVISGWGHGGLPAGSTGFVNWIAFATLTPLTMVFAPLGARLAYRLNTHNLRRVFAVFLLLVAVKMMVA